MGVERDIKAWGPTLEFKGPIGNGRERRDDEEGAFVVLGLDHVGHEPDHLFAYPCVVVHPCAGHVHVQAMCMHVAAIVQALVVRQASKSRHDAHICCPLLTPSLHASAHDYIHAHT